MGNGAAGGVAQAVLLGTHHDNVCALAMTEGDCTVLSAGNDSTVRVWLVRNRTAVRDPIETKDSVTSLSVTIDTRICAGL